MDNSVKTNKSSLRRLVGGLASSTVIFSALTLPSLAGSDKLTVSDPQTKTSEAYAGVEVIQGGNLTGTNLTITQSSNSIGLLVTDGAATLNGSTITQSADKAWVGGVSVIKGTATVTGVKIDVTGTRDASGLLTQGGGYIEARGIEVILSTPSSVTADPSAAVYGYLGGTISTSDSTFTISGTRAYGLLSSGNRGEVTLISHNDTITTNGDRGYGVFAYSEPGGKGEVNITDADITTKGDDAFGLTAQGAASVINASGLSIATEGDRGHGAYAYRGAHISLSDSEITTIGDKAYGLQANGTESVINAKDVTIHTDADWTYGAYAANSGKINLDGGLIETKGARAFGLLSETGATISSSATIITHGEKAHGVQAGANGSTADGSDGSRITLNSGSSVSTEGTEAYGLHAIDGGAIEGTVNVSTKGVKGFGAFAESYSTVELAGGAISTEGVSSHGLLANNDRAKPVVKSAALIPVEAVGGKISATNTTVITSGDNAAGASAENGGAITLVGGSIATSGQNASALQIVNSGTIDVTGTTLASANAATVNVVLDTVGANAKVTLGNGTVATQNNGTLLRVNRSQAGDDGVVQFTLGAGSTSQGDILDEGAKTTGGTDVTLEEGASWTGLLSGVRHFSGFQGGSVVFENAANIVGDLNGKGTSYSFSDLGGTIGGDVNLTSGSSTTGGTIDNRIVVEQNVSVDQTSVLGGNWDIKKNLNNDGILSPGNSIGRVTVGEDLNLSSSSVYQVELDQNGDADLVTVVGTANLDGVVVVSTLNGFQINSPYTILTAGERNGEFQSAEFANSSAFLDARLAYSPTDVTLSVERNATSFGSVAQTRNQTAVAEALDLLPLSNAVANSIILSSAEDARNAFTQLSGDTHASIKTGLIDTANLTTDTINNRLRAAFEGVAAKDAPVLSFSQSPKGSAPQPFDAVSPASSDYSVWASGFGSWVDRDGNTNMGGLKTSTGGFLSGVDVGVASGWRLGVVGGYSQTDLDAKGRFASATSDNWHLGIYGGNQWGPIGLRAGLVHTWNNIDSSRSVAYPGFSDSLDADYDARTLQAFGELGYRIDAASASFEPFANLSHVRLRTDGFNENGGAAALSVDSETTNTTFTTVGLRASAPLTLGTTTANLKGTLGWRHAYGDITPESTQFLAGSNAFTVEGVTIAKDAALVEAGFDLAITESATFGVSYIGQFGDGTTQNGFNASLNVKF